MAVKAVVVGGMEVGAMAVAAAATALEAVATARVAAATEAAEEGEPRRVRTEGQGGVPETVAAETVAAAREVKLVVVSTVAEKMAAARVVAMAEPETQVEMEVAMGAGLQWS